MTHLSSNRQHHNEDHQLSPELTIIKALKLIDKVLSSHRNLDLNNREIIRSITSLCTTSPTLGHLFNKITTAPNRKRRVKDLAYRPTKRLGRQDGYVLRQRHTATKDPNHCNQGAVDATRCENQGRAEPSEHDRQATPSQDTATDACQHGNTAMDAELGGSTSLNTIYNRHGPTRRRLTISTKTMTPFP